MLQFGKALHGAGLECLPVLVEPVLLIALVLVLRQLAPCGAHPLVYRVDLLSRWHHPDVCDRGRLRAAVVLGVCGGRARVGEGEDQPQQADTTYQDGGQGDVLALPWRQPLKGTAHGPLDAVEQAGDAPIGCLVERRVHRVASCRITNTFVVSPGCRL